MPTNQMQVLRAIYEWRVIGRFALAGEKKGETQVFDGVPIYLIHAELDGSDIDVDTTLRLLEIKQMVPPPGHYAHYEGAWELPDGRTITARCRILENNSRDVVVFCGVRTDVFVDDRLIEGELDARITDLTSQGLELIENSHPQCQKVHTRAQLRQRAERYVKSRAGVFPGVRALAQVLGCAKSSLLNAIQDSRYLMARKAEHERGTRTVRTQALSEYNLNELKQSTEADPPDTLDDLVAEQQADLREDARQMRRPNRRP